MWLFVGLGMRGPGAVERWTHIPGIQIMALCDHEKDRAEACQKILRKASMPAADIYSGEDGYKGTVQAQGHRPGVYRYRLAAPFPGGTRGLCKTVTTWLSRCLRQ